MPLPLGAEAAASIGRIAGLRHGETSFEELLVARRLGKVDAATSDCETAKGTRDDPSMIRLGIWIYRNGEARA